MDYVDLSKQIGSSNRKYENLIWNREVIKNFIKKYLQYLTSILHHKSHFTHVIHININVVFFPSLVSIKLNSTFFFWMIKSMKTVYSGKHTLRVVAPHWHHPFKIHSTTMTLTFKINISVYSIWNAYHFFIVRWWSLWC